MKHGILAQAVRDLRKEKGFSQKELGNISGLSLRTIQRIENGETNPTGETLKRLSNSLDISPDELLDWKVKKASLKVTFKTKFDYCHIFEDKIVITKTPETKDLVADYSKSVNDFFKTLMVFFISIPIFTAISIFMYYDEKFGISISSGAFAFFFLIMAFYSMLFTSGTSIIKKNTIIKIKVKKRSLGTLSTIQINYKDFGRIKRRGLIVENNQFDTTLNILKHEGLLKEQDIDYNNGKVKKYSLIISIILIWIMIHILPTFFFDFLPRSERSLAGSGVFILMISFALLSYMIRYAIRCFINKKHKHSLES